MECLKNDWIVNKRIMNKKNYEWSEITMNKRIKNEWLMNNAWKIN